MPTKGLALTEGISVLHRLRDTTKESLQKLKDTNAPQRLSEGFDSLRDRAVLRLNRGDESDDFSHIYRLKSRWEMIRISAAVMGIEFCYAAETAFVSPTLLKIGVSHVHMTLIWCLSPLVGFFLTPVLGSLSDRCRSRLGRRRPFILLLSVGIILGLLLVPNGKDIGVSLGDYYPPYVTEQETNLTDWQNDTLSNSTTTNITSYNHPWGLLFTVIGTVLLDFDSDACQSPSRAYLLDVTLPDDHAKGLSTFTVVAGLGGSLGYALGGIDWDATFIGIIFGGHVRAVFTLILFIFVGCLFTTIFSFREIPLDVLSGEVKTTRKKIFRGGKYRQFTEEEEMTVQGPSYGALDNGTTVQETSFVATSDSEQFTCDGVSDGQVLLPSSEASPTLGQYLSSIILMPNSLRVLCLTNLLCWMSLVCYSLYFTDFVGEAVFGGDPQAPIGSPPHLLYEQGVRFGCWGMAVYSLSCSMYSFVIDRLVARFRAKPVYICGQLVYSFGMVLMALLRHKASIILLSCTAGIMYSTLFTMPYLLVAHYHANNTLVPYEPPLCRILRALFPDNTSKSQQQFTAEDRPKASSQIRGLGTDVAIVSSMVFLAQFILSACMGSLVQAVNSTVAVVCSAAVLSFCGALSATQVMYLDL